MAHIVKIWRVAGRWFCAGALLPALACSPLNLSKAYTADSFGGTMLQGARALYVPLDRVVTEYHDNTRARPQRQYTDTFFLDAANGLVAFELARVFDIINLSDSLADSLKSLPRPGYTRIDTSTDSLERAVGLIRLAADLAGADYVIVPFSCSIRHTVVKQAGWRNDKYESGHYERPTTHIARARCHLQVWTKNGELLYERSAVAVTQQPFLYSVFRQEKKNRDIAEFARKYFAPPMVKALYKAVKDAVTPLR